MKILVMSLQDSGGGCGKLTRAIDEHPDHQAKGVRWAKGKLVNYDISEKYCFWRPDANKTNNFLKWCDAVITTGPWCGLTKTLPWGTKSLFPPNAPKKPLVVNYRGTPYRKRKEWYNKVDKERKAIQTGNFIDLLCYGNFRGWLPVPVWTNELKKYRKTTSRFVVAQSVTQHKRAHLKSIPTVKNHLERLDGIHFDYIHNLPHNECLARMGQADVVITAFKNGFGNSGLEAMAMGIPIIGNGFDAYINKFIELCGELPFYRAKLGYISQAVCDLKDDKELYDHYVNAGKLYLERFHNPAIVAEKAAMLCNLAIKMS